MQPELRVAQPKAAGELGPGEAFNLQRAHLPECAGSGDERAEDGGAAGASRAQGGAVSGFGRLAGEAAALLALVGAAFAVAAVALLAALRA